MGSFCFVKIILNYLLKYDRLNNAKLIEYNITSIISKGIVFLFAMFLFCS